jgi:hypothetical protein
MEGSNITLKDKVDDARLKELLESCAPPVNVSRIC